MLKISCEKSQTFLIFHSSSMTIHRNFRSHCWRSCCRCLMSHSAMILRLEIFEEREKVQNFQLFTSLLLSQLSQQIFGSKSKFFNIIISSVCWKGFRRFSSLRIWTRFFQLTKRQSRDFTKLKQDQITMEKYSRRHESNRSSVEFTPISNFP